MKRARKTLMAPYFGSVVVCLMYVIFPTVLGAEEAAASASC